jgi:hypothetical protein
MRARRQIRKRSILSRGRREIDDINKFAVMAHAEISQVKQFRCAAEFGNRANSAAPAPLDRFRMLNRCFVVLT